MDPLPSVTLVIPAFNAGDTLADCLASVRALDYPADRLEVIVVDNGSSDGTPDLIRGWRGIRHAFETKRGAAAARNHGARVASHEILAFTDADCILDPAWLRHLVTALADRSAGLAGGRILARPGGSSIERFGERIHDHESAIGGRFPCAIGMSWACRRSQFWELGGFDESFLRCQDSDLSFRFHESGYRLTYVPESVLFHRNRDSLRGLFREGAMHGHWSVLWCRKHAATLRRVGRRQFSLRGIRDVVRHVRAAITRDRERRIEHLCNAAFAAGKQWGKLTGSIRFSHVEL
jgi:GT2 family glycosyltransferase